MSERFSCVPYRADGGYSSGGAALLIGLCCLTGVALGFVASFIGQWFYLLFLFPLAIGLGVGGAGAGTIRVWKVRSPLLAGAAGFLGGVLAILSMHFFNYLRFQSTLDEVDPAVLALAEKLDEMNAKINDLSPEDQQIVQELNRNPAELAALRARSFLGYMNAEAVAGVSIGRARAGNDKGMNLGYVGSYIYWFAEVLVVAGLSFYIMRIAASSPFCTQCESWKEDQVLGGLKPPVAEAVDAIKSGDTAAIRQRQPSAEPGELLVTASVCPQCRENAPFEVKMEQVSINKKGETSKKDLAIVTYPGVALSAMTNLFAVPATAVENKESM